MENYKILHTCVGTFLEGETVAASDLGSRKNIQRLLNIKAIQQVDAPVAFTPAGVQLRADGAGTEGDEGEAEVETEVAPLQPAAPDGAPVDIPPDLLPTAAPPPDDAPPPPASKGKTGRA